MYAYFRASKKLLWVGIEPAFWSICLETDQMSQAFILLKLIAHISAIADQKIWMIPFQKLLLSNKYSRKLAIDYK